MQDTKNQAITKSPRIAIFDSANSFSSYSGTIPAYQIQTELHNLIGKFLQPAIDPISREQSGIYPILTSEEQVARKVADWLSSDYMGAFASEKGVVILAKKPDDLTGDFSYVLAKLRERAGLPELHTGPFARFLIKRPIDLKRPALYDMADAELLPLPDFEEQGERENESQLLRKLLDVETIVGEKANSQVVFTPPLISRGETGIIGRRTINIIQGGYGSHKSRFAELFTAFMLTKNPYHPQYLELRRTAEELFCLCYIDSERNLAEELPFAIQSIKVKAGYRTDEAPPNFRYTSIKGVERKDRFAAIETFISDVRAKTQLHLFCVIDVVTDAVSDFNDARESMRLYDFIGNLCDNYDSTFLLVIHQNPGTEKARGHTGTEAANKASTVMQIGYEQDGRGNDTDLIRLRFLKLRRGKKPDPIYLQYDDLSKGLILADSSQITALINHRKQKADVEDLADRLTTLLADGPMQKGDVVKKLEEEFGAKNATIRERLRTIKDEQPAMYNEEGQAVKLGEFRDGREQYYKLIPY